jgi:hypothetical protein
VEFVGYMELRVQRSNAATRDVLREPTREEFVARMEQVKYKRDAGTRDVLNLPKREDFVRSIIECLLSQLKFKMWKRDMR